MNFASLRPLSVLALGAFAFGPAAAAAPRIGVLLKGRTGFWSAMEKGAAAAGAQAGADVIVRAPLAETDVAVQIRLLSALAPGTPGTMAMLKLLEPRDPPGAIKFVGFGFNLNPEVAAAIARGTMQGWIAQLPQEVGAKGVQAALALLDGRPVPPVIYTDFIVVTRDNLGKPEVQALLQ